jgi:SpoVK/Ycf46/Vps4 family AAA+-type ATPase
MDKKLDRLQAITAQGDSTNPAARKTMAGFHRISGLTDLERLQGAQEQRELDRGGKSNEGGEIRQFAEELKTRVRQPMFRMDQVVLPPETRRQVDVTLQRIRNHKLLYEDWGLAEVDPFGRRTAINLYGKPGTGKTTCAEALASALQMPILDMDYATLESKYVGETGKRIRAAFLAAKETGSLLLFDEADSILGKRMTNITQATDQAVNNARAVMLKALDAFEGVVVFATNLARNFDGAFVRRILQHVEIPLPDQDGRKTLWQRKVPTQVPGRGALDWDQLAAWTEGFSGGDIMNAVIAGLTEASGRQGDDRKATMADFERAIKVLQHAKTVVGVDPDVRDLPVAVQQTTIPLSEAISGSASTPN